jgi:hypothetical protein
MPGEFVKKGDVHEGRAGVVSDMLNHMDFDPVRFCEFMQRDHRTLQQNFTRLCVEWLKTCASSDYRTDGRNADSARVAHLLLDNVVQSELFIPYI